MRIGVLICDHLEPEFLQISGNYLKMFDRLFSRYQNIDLIPYDAIGSHLPDRPDECDAWLTTGSRYSVNDDQAWIRQTERFVRKVSRTAIPLVGICFGHQLIATALGGTVTGSRGWSVGVKGVEISQELPWMDPPRSSYQLLSSHSDQVDSAPPKAQVVGRSDKCPISMVTVGESILGIQDHPEMDSSFVEALIRSRRGTTLPFRVADEGLASLIRPTDEHIIARWIMKFMLG